MGFLILVNGCILFYQDFRIMRFHFQCRFLKMKSPRAGGGGTDGGQNKIHSSSEILIYNCFRNNKMQSRVCRKIKIKFRVNKSELKEYTLFRETEHNN
jgi:hypothetical protein